MSFFGKLLLVAPVLLCSVFSFYMGQWAVDDSVDHDTQVTVIEAIKAETSQSCEYEVGDLIPCHEDIAEFELVFEGFVGESPIGKMQLYFCKYDGMNDDSETAEALHSGVQWSCGQGRRFGQIIRIEELSEKGALINIDWKRSEDGLSSELVAKVFFPAKSRGQYLLDGGKSLPWTFLPIGSSGE